MTELLVFSTPMALTEAEHERLSSRLRAALRAGGTVPLVLDHGVTVQKIEVVAPEVCAYCGATCGVRNARGGLECVGCGHPL